MVDIRAAWAARTWPATAEWPSSIGPGTYSSGEALAYHLSTRGRVRLFGRRTPGAADHVTPVRVSPSVVALIPEATTIDVVSGRNWEGTGVVPDVSCAEPAAGGADDIDDTDDSDSTVAAALAWLKGDMAEA